MFKKALKIIAPSVVGSVTALIIVALVLGVRAVTNAIIPVFLANCWGFTAALYFTTKEDNDKDK